MTLNSNFSSFSTVTEGAPLSPAYLNSKFSVLNANLNDLNKSTQSFDHVSVTTLSIIRAGSSTTGQIYVTAANDVRVNAQSNNLEFAVNGTGYWAISSAGVFHPKSGSVYDIGIVSPGAAVRAIHVNHITSMLTHATLSKLSVGEMGLVYQSSGLSLVIRSGDTYYDLGSGTSIGV